MKLKIWMKIMKIAYLTEVPNRIPRGKSCRKLWEKFGKQKQKNCRKLGSCKKKTADINPPPSFPYASQNFVTHLWGEGIIWSQFAMEYAASTCAWSHAIKHRCIISTTMANSNPPTTKFDNFWAKLFQGQYEHANIFMKSPTRPIEQTSKNKTPITTRSAREGEYFP